MKVYDKNNINIGIIENNILKIHNNTFKNVELSITKNEDGTIYEDTHQWENKKYKTALVTSLQYLIENDKNIKSKEDIKFCKFNINKIYQKKCGIYIWVQGNEIIYIGKTVNLLTRFNSGYGRISPRNCYIGGQSTNCKMNHAFYEIYKNGGVINLYFKETLDYNNLEKELLQLIPTKYNSVH